MKRFISKFIIQLLLFLISFNQLYGVIVFKNYISYDYNTDRYSAKSVFDFSKISDITQRKKLFCDFMSLIIDSENQEILANRKKILELSKKNRLTADEANYINNIEKVYKLELSESYEQVNWKEILSRVDIIPRDLAISQTAIETGWGTSVFAKKANNMFGHWTYKQGSGIVPSRREEGQTHEIAIFNSVNDSVKKYMLNLNTNRAYKQFRLLRKKLRNKNLTVNGEALSPGLVRYSGIGDDYVRMINLIIRDISKNWRTND